MLTLAQARLGKLTQLTVWSPPRAMMEMKSWQPRPGWHYHPQQRWSPTEHPWTVQQVEYGDWLQKEQQRIARDRTRVAMLVEDGGLVALFVNCVISACNHTEQDHVGGHVQSVIARVPA